MMLLVYFKALGVKTTSHAAEKTKRRGGKEERPTTMNSHIHKQTNKAKATSKRMRKGKKLL